MQNVHTAYDDVTIALIPTNAYAIAYYMDGPFRQDPSVLRKRFPHTMLIPISTTGIPGARFYDCELGDLTPAQTAASVKRELDAHRLCGPYASVSNMGGVVMALEAVGVPRIDYLLWTAHYTGQAHICSPSTCAFPGFGYTADGTQFTDRAENRSLDESLVTDRWLGITAPPAAHSTGLARVEVGFDLAAKTVHELHHLPGRSVKFAGPGEWLDVPQIQVRAGNGGGEWRVKP